MAANEHAEASRADAFRPEASRSAEIQTEDDGCFGDFATMSAISCPDSSHVEGSGQLRGSVCAVIVAGGTGSRFGNPGGKQLVEIAGRIGLKIRQRIPFASSSFG